MILLLYQDAAVKVEHFFWGLAVFERVPQALARALLHVVDEPLGCAEVLDYVEVVTLGLEDQQGLAVAFEDLPNKVF